MDESIYHERFNLFDYVPVGVCIINRDYEVLYWNFTIEEWTKIKKDNIIGKSLFDFFPNVNDFKYTSRISAIFDGGPPTIFSSQLHKNFFTSYLPDGQLRFQHTTVSAIPSVTTNDYYAIFSIEDVSSLSQRLKEYRILKDQALEEVRQRRLAEEALRKSENELRELNMTKDKFFSIIAHDIKNPLGTSMNVSEFLYNDFENFSPEEVKDFINDIMVSSKGLYSLLEELLNWARVQTGRIDYNPEDNDIAEVIANSLSLLKMNAEKKNINFTSTIEAGTFAYFDFKMINTVIRNLSSNAIKFTPENGSVTISAIKGDEFLTIKVSDTGIGISQDDIKKLFRIDVHHTTIGTSQEKGTGLGLIICKEFVEFNKGKIWVESELNKGTDFIFTLPNATF